MFLCLFDCLCACLFASCVSCVSWFVGLFVCLFVCLCCLGLVLFSPVCSCLLLFAPVCSRLLLFVCLFVCLLVRPCFDELVVPAVSESPNRHGPNGSQRPPLLDSVRRESEPAAARKILGGEKKQKEKGEGNGAFCPCSEKLLQALGCLPGLGRFSFVVVHAGLSNITRSNPEGTRFGQGKHFHSIEQHTISLVFGDAISGQCQRWASQCTAQQSRKPAVLAGVL